MKIKGTYQVLRCQVLCEVVWPSAEGAQLARPLGYSAVADRGTMRAQALYDALQVPADATQEQIKDS